MFARPCMRELNSILALSLGARAMVGGVSREICPGCVGEVEIQVRCARALDDSTPHAVLKGPSSDSVVTHFSNPLAPRCVYRFNFDNSPESIRRCVDSMFDFFGKTGETWFREWREQHPVAGRRLSHETADVLRLHDDVAV